MSGSKPWAADDRAGGPIDDILRAVRAELPDATISRLVGTHPADDDHVYWIRRAGVEVQVDTRPGGYPPFTVEGDEPQSRLDPDDADSAAAHIVRLLSASAG